MLRLFSKLRKLIDGRLQGDQYCFVLIMSLFFCISFNYHVLKSLKDVLLLKAPGSGSETIPFIKVWVMIPAAFLVSIGTSRLFKKCDTITVLMKVVTIFGIIFLLSPSFFWLRKIFKFEALCSFLTATLPSGAGGFITLVRNWPQTIFYVVSEMWSAIVFSTILWSISNTYFSIGMARKMYPFFSLASNIAGLVAGRSLAVLSASKLFIRGLDHWEQTLALIYCFVIIFTSVILTLLFFLKKRFDATMPSLTQPRPLKKKKTSFKEGILQIVSSRHLLLIASIVFCYNMSIGLVEVSWKHVASMTYLEKNDFLAFFASVSEYTSILSVLFSLFITGYVLKRLTWTQGAIVPVMIMTLTGIPFFILILQGNGLFPLFLVDNPILFATFVGGIQNCLTRASKFSFFDPLKEISFIPVDKEKQLKSKPFIDAIMSRGGKSGSALFYQTLYFAGYTTATTLPLVASFFIFTVALWSVSVLFLGKRMSGIYQVSKMR